MTKTPKRNFREKLRRLNALANPDGWSHDFNFDRPAWRYVLAGAILGGMFLAGSSLDGTLSALDWVISLFVALPLCLVSPLRALYLRNHPQRTEPFPLRPDSEKQDGRNQ